MVEGATQPPSPAVGQLAQDRRQAGIVAWSYLPASPVDRPPINSAVSGVCKGVKGRREGTAHPCFHMAAGAKKIIPSRNHVTRNSAIPSPTEPSGDLFPRLTL